MTKRSCQYCSDWKQSLLFSSFDYFSTRQVAPVDRSAPNFACKCGFGQGCACWGSRWWPITFRGSDPQNQNFGGVNRHFKPNLQKIQIVISSKLCIGLAWNLKGRCSPMNKLRAWSYMMMWQIQDGGRPPSWISILSHNFGVDQHFCTKFGTMMENLQPKGFQFS